MCSKRCTCRNERCGEALRSSCLLPSALAPSPQDGVIQLSVDGQCTWLLSDAASASCVVIDPAAELVPRLAAFIRCQHLALRAIVHTAAPADHGVARLALLQELAIEQVGRVDIDGGLALGQQRLRQIECGETHVYLLGQRFAFIGNLAPDALTPLLEAALVTPDTVLCGSRDDGDICSTVRAVREGIVAAADRQLDAAALPGFLRQHPDAILVDVREAYEHAACAGTVFEGCAVHSVPLSRLAGQVAAWLQQPQRPLIFFCRSGNRSARAAACLRRLGHAAAWQLNGGMAMAEATRLPLAIAA